MSLEWIIFGQLNNIMEIKTIISEQPKCKTCGVKMNEWNPFADEHEHIECASERISNNLIAMVKNHFKNEESKDERSII